MNLSNPLPRIPEEDLSRRNGGHGVVFPPQVPLRRHSASRERDLGKRRSWAGDYVPSAGDYAPYTQNNYNESQESLINEPVQRTNAVHRHSGNQNVEMRMELKIFIIVASFVLTCFAIYGITAYYCDVMITDPMGGFCMKPGQESPCTCMDLPAAETETPPPPNEHYCSVKCEELDVCLNTMKALSGIVKRK